MYLMRVFSSINWELVVLLSCLRGETRAGIWRCGLVSRGYTLVLGGYSRFDKGYMTVSGGLLERSVLCIG